MAIDYTGKTATSTTGTIGATPFVPKAPDTSNLGVSQPIKKTPSTDIAKKPVAPQARPSVNLQDLQDDDKRTLNVHLTPSLKGVLIGSLALIYSQDWERGNPQSVYQRKLLKNDLAVLTNLCQWYSQ